MSDENIKDLDTLVPEIDSMPDNLFGETATDDILSVHRESKRLYFDMLAEFNSICEQLKASDKSVDGNKLAGYVATMIESLKQDDRMLLGLANAPYSYVLRQTNNRESVFGTIVIHGMNITIYALKMLIDLAIPANRLPYLGMASLFSRLGLLDADPQLLVEYSDKPEHASEIDKFEKFSKKYISRLKIDNFHIDSIDTVISMVKEQQQALSKTSLNEAVHQYAMVIHICDEFEKLTHQKTYGEMFAPIDAMKRMRNEMKDYFNQDIIKFFFNKLSIYPLGSYVKLSSQEIAKIVNINENFIMRPVVVVVIDSEGREKETPVRLNLRERPTIYIKKPVIDEFLSDKFIFTF